MASDLKLNIPIAADIKEATGDLKGAKSAITAEIRELKKAIKEAKEAGDDAGVSVGTSRINTLQVRKEEVTQKIEIQKQTDLAVKNSVANEITRISSKATQLARGGVSARNIQEVAPGLAEALMREAVDRQGSMLGRAAAGASRSITAATSLAKAAAPTLGAITAVIGAGAAAVAIDNKFKEELVMMAKEEESQANILAEFAAGFTNKGGITGERLDEVVSSLEYAGGRRKRFQRGTASFSEATQDMLFGWTAYADKAATESMKNDLFLKQAAAMLGPAAANITVEGIKREPQFKKRFGRIPHFFEDTVEGQASPWSRLGGNMRNAAARNLQEQAEKEARARMESQIAWRERELKKQRENPVRAFNTQTRLYHLKAVETKEYSDFMQWNKT